MITTSLVITRKFLSRSYRIRTQTRWGVFIIIIVLIILARFSFSRSQTLKGSMDIALASTAGVAIVFFEIWIRHQWLIRQWTLSQASEPVTYTFDAESMTTDFVMGKPIS